MCIDMLISRIIPMCIVVKPWGGIICVRAAIVMGIFIVVVIVIAVRVRIVVRICITMWCTVTMRARIVMYIYNLSLRLHPLVASFGVDKAFPGTVIKRRCEHWNVCHGFFACKRIKVKCLL